MAQGKATVYEAERLLASGAALFGPRGLLGRDEDPALPFDFVEMFHQVTKDLPEEVALLNENWRIISINKNWKDAANKAGLNALKIGGDYKRFWAEKFERCPPADAVLDGLSQLEAGDIDSFRFSIEGLGEQAGLTFEICLNRIWVQERTVLVVTSSDVTELCDLRRLRDRFSEILVEGRAEERRRIARELHDSTMQLLTYLNLAIGRLKRSEPSEQALEIVDEMEDILHQAQAELRTLAYLAHPPLVEELGLHQALAALVDGFSRRSGLHVTLDWHGDLMDDDRIMEVPLFRIVQEALSNIYRHAHAKNVIITVVTGDASMEVRVTDDGGGMPQRPRSGVGISGMRARLKELGGKLTVRSSSSGTQVIARVPRPTAVPEMTRVWQSGLPEYSSRAEPKG